MLCGIVVWIFSYSRVTQLAVILLAAFGYIGIGVWHHKRAHTLTGRIVIEYITMALLAISVAFLLVKAY